MEMKMTYYHSPLDNPSVVSLDTPSSHPFTRKQSPNRLPSSLFLTAVRATVERGHLKGRRQEVHVFLKGVNYPGGKKTPLLLPKKHVSARKAPKSLPSGNKKNYKT
jgi:hypothetical protein